MKKIIVIALASVALFSCQQEKTAFVNNEKLIEEYQERKDIEDKYKIKVDALTKKKDSIGKMHSGDIICVTILVSIR